MAPSALRVALLASTAAAFAPRTRLPRVRGSDAPFAANLGPQLPPTEAVDASRPPRQFTRQLARRLGLRHHRRRGPQVVPADRTTAARVPRIRRALRVLAANALLAAVLLFAPVAAHAKGGGGGGGGGGSGGRGGSSSRLLSLSQLGWRCSMDEAGYPCWRNAITNQRTWKRPKRQRTAPPVFYAPSFGHLEGRSALASRPARNYVVGCDLVKAEPTNWEGFAVVMGLYGCGVWLTSHWTTPRRNVYQEKLDAWKNLTRTLERDFDGMQRPVSGQYCGDSVESDKGNQDVVSNLRFLSDGSVRGDGVDGVDGKYTLAGRWSGSRCAWIERYAGFEVVVNGWVKKTGDIFIKFCSSRGITGSVDLELLEAA